MNISCVAYGNITFTVDEFSDFSFCFLSEGIFLVIEKVSPWAVFAKSKTTRLLCDLWFLLEVLPDVLNLAEESLDLFLSPVV